MRDIVAEHSTFDCEACSTYVCIFHKKQQCTNAQRKREVQTTYQKKLTTHQGQKEPAFVCKPDTVSFPPPPLKQKELASIVSQFCKAIAPNEFEEVGCAVCGILTQRRLALHKDKVKFDWSLLNTVTGNVAKLEHNSDIDINDYTGPVIDTKCKHVCSNLLLKRKIPLLSLCNGNWIGDIPEQLQGPSYAKKLLIAMVHPNYCMIRVEAGMKKLIANAVLIPNPVPKIYHMLPPHHNELDQILAFVYTGPLPPTKEDLKRTPFILNHSDYTNIEISEENVQSYENGEPPVTIEYHKQDTNKHPIAVGMDDVEGDELGTSSDDCPFIVHGLTTIEHMETGGKSLGIGTSSKLASLYNNPQLYPKSFPWLFPYGLGGIGNEHGSVKVPETHRKCQLLLYHDKRFQLDSTFVLMAFNHSQIKTATTVGFLLTKKSNFDEIANQLLTVNQTILLKLVNRMKMREKAKPAEKEKKYYQIIKVLEHVSGNVEGSGTGRKFMNNEVWALLSYLGAPTWYITFAPADERHPMALYFANNNIKFRKEILPRDQC
ncbi:hypothetical protein M422DRAFT_177292 [Sphaerobolus stellatus SS14]|uniref:Unplaced genomic scaffold SPHSTscaffold_90, whole genome shotgun sequence n=1 Tax=Sphaerobolus stellatus (strain SS14) TaxID=990650 RepID=A0A0C9USW3_SPHS4|nr:hypothetical protein M422DRAFT_177292 [Sphaerobolus stellatus SS14]